MSQPVELTKPLKNKRMNASDAAGRSAGRSGNQAKGGRVGVLDPELADLVDRWPHLPEAIRRAVLALVNAAGE